MVDTGAPSAAPRRSAQAWGQWDARPERDIATPVPTYRVEGVTREGWATLLVPAFATVVGWVVVLFYAFGR